MTAGLPSVPRGLHRFETARYLHERRHKFGLSSFVGSYRLHADSDVFERSADFGIELITGNNDLYEYEVSSGITAQAI